MLCLWWWNNRVLRSWRTFWFLVQEKKALEHAVKRYSRYFWLLSMMWRDKIGENGYILYRFRVIRNFSSAHWRPQDNFFFLSPKLTKPCSLANHLLFHYRGPSNCYCPKAVMPMILEKDAVRIGNRKSVLDSSKILSFWDDESIKAVRCFPVAFRSN